MNTKTDTAENRSLHSLVSCWDCNSTGILALARFNTAGGDIPCDRCNGTGKCPAIMREWQLLGAAYKEARLRNDRSLREEAKLRGYNVVTLSKAERGIIDPRELKAANAGAVAPPPQMPDSTNDVPGG